MANELRILFGQRVRYIRTSKTNMSQEKLAFECNLHRTYISDIERGIRNVSLDNIGKIANALGIELKELFEFNTENKVVVRNELEDLN